MTIFCTIWWPGRSGALLRWFQSWKTWGLLSIIAIISPVVTTAVFIIEFALIPHASNWHGPKAAVVSQPAWSSSCLECCLPPHFTKIIITGQRSWYLIISVWWSAAFLPDEWAETVIISLWEPNLVFQLLRHWSWCCWRNLLKALVPLSPWQQLLALLIY